MNDSETVFARRGIAALLQIPSLAIPETITFEGILWQRKSEFHVTLLGSGSWPDVKSVAAKGKLSTAISRAAAGLAFAVRLRDEFYLVERGRDRSLIQMCEVAGAEEFCVGLERDLGRTIARPPYHVTLYTFGSRRGIGIATQAAFARMATPISAPLW